MQPIRTMHLFAGAGGGILADILLGHQPVCAVEINIYCQQVLAARQKDGCLPWFPIFEDVKEFDGKPWRGIVDVVSGGFPCQDISAAGKGVGITGERSGMWSHMARIIGEVRPRYAYIENSPMLIVRGLDVVLSDLAALGYDAEWGIVSAADCGAPHKRDRIWIVAHSKSFGDRRNIRELSSENAKEREPEEYREEDAKQLKDGGKNEGQTNMADTASVRQQGQREPIDTSNSEESGERQAGNAINECQRREWPSEPGVGRKINGLA